MALRYLSKQDGLMHISCTMKINKHFHKPTSLILKGNHPTYAVPCLLLSGASHLEPSRSDNAFQQVGYQARNVEVFSMLGSQITITAIITISIQKCYQSEVSLILN